MHRPLVAMTIALATASAACSGCKSTSPSAADSGASVSTPPAGLTPEEASRVLAHVGDRTITLGDFQATLDHMDPFDRLRYQSAERRRELLREMIDVMLLADQARVTGADKDPVTQQEVRQILRDAMLKKARKGLPTPAEIPADEVRAYYDAHRPDFHDPERRRVSAIVLPSAAAASGVLSALKGAPPTRWGELVRAKSIDPQAKANVPVDLAGDLGFVSPPGDPRGANPRVPDEVRAALFQLASPGDVAPSPVAAGGQYFVVKLTGKTDPHDRTLGDVEQTIRVKLAQQRIHDKEESLLEDLRTRFPVKVDDHALATVQVGLGAVDAGPDAR